MSFSLITRRSLKVGGGLVVGVCLALGRNSMVATPPPAALANSDYEAEVQQFESDRNSVGQFYSLPWSEARFDRLERLGQEWQARVKIAGFKKLNVQGQVDQALLLNLLQRSQARLERDRQRLQDMRDLLPFREAIQKLELARWHMTPLDAQAAATELAGVPEQIKKLRERLDAGRKDKPKDKATGDDKKETTETKEEPSKTAGTNAPSLKISATLARRAASATDEVRQTLKNWFNAYDGVQPEFSWWLKKPQEETAKALEEYAKCLREELAGLKGKPEDPLVGEPFGAAALQTEITTEFLPYTPRELIAIGEREFAWCEEQMRKAAADMGVADWKAALAGVKSQHVPPGKQEEVVATEGRAAVQFVREHDLVTVPPLCEETWRLTMLNSEQQKTMPYAAYGGQSVLVAYAREDMKHEDKVMSMRGNNRPFMHLVIPHELVPGHHLQNFVGSRYQQQRSLFATPFLVEGWALYWELRLWDLGYARTPEERVGMLFWRMHRCARIIVSLKFHLGEMTPPQMVDFLMARVGHEKLGATSEVRRYISDDYSPLYQAAYMLGGLQLYTLHKETVGKKKMSEREFHDAVLRQGAIPVDLIRRVMLELPVKPGAAPDWRFAQ